ncbi:MAG: hypothetical protein C4539_03795 [Ignavibacteriales bacterium]|jgi:hypothetical protein|nr:MAG: hypothetical protein C4539_03795 [Ignavibacteriales bacterium]
MAAENEKDIDINKILHNKLKSVSIDSLETGISKVITDLVGEDYRCSIGNIKYTLFSGAEISLKIELTLKDENAPQL